MSRLHLPVYVREPTNKQQEILRRKKKPNDVQKDIVSGQLGYIGYRVLDFLDLCVIGR